MYELTKNLNDEKVRALQQGELVDWINESHTMVPGIYDNLPKKKEGEINIDDEYLVFATPIIEQQMLAAGVRLAKFLDDVMGKVAID